MSSKSIAKQQFRLAYKQQLSEYIRDLVWSPDGNYLAVISAAGELALWHEGKFNLLTSPRDYSLDCVGFSADSKWLASAGQAGQVKLWQLEANSQTFKLITTLDNNKAWLDTLAWHPQQNWLAFAVNREIQIWDGETQKIVTTLNFADSSVFSLAWHPQGNLLAASGHGGVKVWRNNNWQEKPDLLEVPGASLDCAWSFDGQYLASGNLDRTISLFQWDNPPPWLMQGFPGKVSQVTWSQTADRPLLAASCQEGIIVWQYNRQSRNWQNHILQHQKTVRAIAFTPNSDLLASVSDDGFLKLWHQGKKLIQTLKRKGKFSGLAWHPTGKYLATGEQNGEVVIYQSSSSGKGFGN